MLRARRSARVFWPSGQPDPPHPQKKWQQPSQDTINGRTWRGLVVIGAKWSSLFQGIKSLFFHDSMMINDAHHSQTSHYWHELAIYVSWGIGTWLLVTMCIFCWFCACMKVCQKQVKLLTFHPNNRTYYSAVCHTRKISTVKTCWFNWPRSWRKSEGEGNLYDRVKRI